MIRGRAAAAPGRWFGRPWRRVVERLESRTMLSAGGVRGGKARRVGAGGRFPGTFSATTTATACATPARRGWAAGGSTWTRTRTGRRARGSRTTETDASGRFVFSGLRAGTYWVRAELPAGSRQTTPAVGRAAGGEGGGGGGGGSGRGRRHCSRCSGSCRCGRRGRGSAGTRSIPRRRRTRRRRWARSAGGRRWTSAAATTADGDLLLHYGSPLVTGNNTVILPLKTSPAGDFAVEARDGATGALQVAAADRLRAAPLPLPRADLRPDAHARRPALLRRPRRHGPMARQPGHLGRRRADGAGRLLRRGCLRGRRRGVQRDRVRRHAADVRRRGQHLLRLPGDRRQPAAPAGRHRPDRRRTGRCATSPPRTPPAMRRSRRSRTTAPGHQRGRLADLRRGQPDAPAGRYQHQPRCTGPELSCWPSTAARSRRSRRSASRTR